MYRVVSTPVIDWNEIRKRFPVTETVAYLNSAAAGPVSRAARDAALGYYEKMMRDGDVQWNQWLAQRETIRTKIARFINAEPDEIGLTTNTSSGMNGIVDALENRGEVISSTLEFPSPPFRWIIDRFPFLLPWRWIAEVEFKEAPAAIRERTGLIVRSPSSLRT